MCRLYFANEPARASRRARVPLSTSSPASQLSSLRVLSSAALLSHASSAASLPWLQHPALSPEAKQPSGSGRARRTRSHPAASPKDPLNAGDLRADIPASSGSGSSLQPSARQLNGRERERTRWREVGEIKKGGKKEREKKVQISATLQEVATRRRKSPPPL